MKPWHNRLIAFLRLLLLDWKFRKGAPASSMATPEETAGRYEEVEEVCLRRGQRSRKVVRRLVEEA